VRSRSCMRFSWKFMGCRARPPIGPHPWASHRQWF
jgi:hypothetical protein